MIRISSLIGDRLIVCNVTSFEAVIKVDGGSPSTGTELSTELCGLSDRQIASLSAYMSANLNAMNVLTVRALLYKIN